MPTSTRFAVAVHVLATLALHPGEKLCSELIARSAGTNPVVIRRLLSMLSRAGLAHSQSGVGGGSVLLRPPEAITLLDIYRAVEDPNLFSLPRCTPNEKCPVGRAITPVLCQVTTRAQTAMETELNSMTLAHILTSLKP
jgi:Rrf2 family protein